MSIETIVRDILTRLDQRADGTYYGTHKLPGERRYALSCSAPDSGAPGLTDAVNAALAIDGHAVRVVVGDAGLGSPWNAQHGVGRGGIKVVPSVL